MIKLENLKFLSLPQQRMQSVMHLNTIGRLIHALYLGKSNVHILLLCQGCSYLAVIVGSHQVSFFSRELSLQIERADVEHLLSR